MIKYHYDFVLQEWNKLLITNIELIVSLYLQVHMNKLLAMQIDESLKNFWCDMNRFSLIKPFLHQQIVSQFTSSNTVRHTCKQIHLYTNLKVNNCWKEIND